VLSPVSGLFCHRHLAKNFPQGLAPASRRQDHTTSPSRGAMRPEFCISLSLSEIRGRREDRVRAAPAVSRANDAQNGAHEHTGSAENTPAFPAQWLYGLYGIVLVTGFLATSCEA